MDRSLQESIAFAIYLVIVLAIGIIFFLTGGKPTVADSATTLAGATDILVTWIYNLTMTLNKYNYASVLAVVIFIVMAPFAIFTFRSTKAFKEGEI